MKDYCKKHDDYNQVHFDLVELIVKEFHLGVSETLDRIMWKLGLRFEHIIRKRMRWKGWNSILCDKTDIGTKLVGFD